MTSEQQQQEKRDVDAFIERLAALAEKATAKFSPGAVLYAFNMAAVQFGARYVSASDAAAIYRLMASHLDAVAAAQKRTVN